MKTLVLLALGSLFVSCGGGGGISSGGSIPAAEACGQASTAVCAKLFGCTGNSIALVKILIPTEDSCKTTVLQYCGATGFQCAADATYHGDAAQTCKDKFSAQSCATLDAALGNAFMTGSLSATTAIGGITASIPECGAICTGGADAGGAG